MLRHALLGALASATVFGLIMYRSSAVREVPRETEATPQAASSGLPPIKPQREAAAPPRNKADIDAVVRQTMAQRAAELPSLQDRFMEEPIDAKFADSQEPQVWDKVSKLPGVKSAVVQCRTYHCKVTLTGKVEPAVSLDVPGLTFRGTENGALVFLYNPDLAAAE